MKNLRNKIIARFIVFLCLYLISQTTATLSAQPKIENVRFYQGKEGAVLIYYELVNPYNDVFDITLEPSEDGGNTFILVPKTVKGDVGKDIVGKGEKCIIWDVEKDYPELKGENFVFLIEAKDKMYDLYYQKGLGAAGKSQWIEAVSAYKKSLEYRPGDSKAENELKFVQQRQVEEAKKKKYGNMVLIPAGEFTMGSDSGESDEKPPHRVYLDAYWIDKYEVTFDQYDKFCEATGRSKPSDSGWGRGNRPVINVSWNDAVSYAKWAGKRLPTEAEWEKACRAGSTSKYCYGNSESMLGDYAWYSSNSGSKTHPVGQKKPNAWGIYDMHGNVWEWCSDWYDSGYYKVAAGFQPAKNPKGPNSGSVRVLRGGSWCGYAISCRSSIRGRSSPDYRNYFGGFRCAASGAQ